MTSRMQWCGGLVAAAAAVLAGCAGYSPGDLAPGTPVSDVMARMGQPTNQYPQPDGSRRLEYARGPYGKHTYMIDVNPQGQVTGWQQVLTEKNFEALPVGMPESELLYRLGRPSDAMSIPRRGERVWSYRYDAIFCQWFQVSLDNAGRVTSTGYGVDPLCDVNDRDDRSSLRPGSRPPHG